MAASTARAYPNSERASSHFSLPTLVESSSWPPVYRLLLLKMLEKNRFGTELFRSTKNLSIALGVSYTTVKRMLDRLENGHEFGKKNRVRCEGVLTLVYEANSRPGGKLRRQRTYQLRQSNLRPRPTEQDIENRSRGALCPLPVAPERPIPPATAKPAEHHSEHRSAARSKQESVEQPKLTRRECARFVGQVVEVKKAHGVSFREALKLVCEGWQRTPESALEALKFWGYKTEESEGP